MIVFESFYSLNVMKLFAVTEIRNVIVISSNFADFKGMTRNLQLCGRFEGAVD